MPVEKFHNKYRIGTKRASWHDYNGGEYFITICTKDRKHYFGEIVDGEMQLSAVGKYTDECVQKISEHNPYAQIPQYVIMPDHIHLIVIISGDDCRNAPWRVSTNGTADGKNKKFKSIEYFPQIRNPNNFTSLCNEKPIIIVYLCAL